MERTRRTSRTVAVVVAAALALGMLSGCSSLPWASEGAGRVAGSTGSQAAPAALPPELAQGGAVKDAASSPAAAGAAPSRESVATADRMVIRSGNVRVRVAKVQGGVTAVRALTARAGGYVTDLQLSSDTNGPTPVPLQEGSGQVRTLSTGLPYTASITVQVPAAKFDAFRAQVEKLGTVLSESTSAQDVTQQHVDLKARLLNARAEEVRLRGFLDKARTVSDMLAVERELARVRSDIESMDAQLKSLEQQAAMATLTVELVEPEPIVRPAAGVDWGFGGALTTGIQGLVGLLQGLIVIVIATAPLWLAALALFFLIRWRVRSHRSRRATGMPASDVEAPVEDDDTSAAREG